MKRRSASRDMRHFMAHGGGQDVLARFIEHGFGQNDRAMEGDRSGDIRGAEQLYPAGGERSLAAREQWGQAAGRGIAPDLVGAIQCAQEERGAQGEEKSIGAEQQHRPIVREGDGRRGGKRDGRCGLGGDGWREEGRGGWARCRRYCQGGARWSAHA